MKRVYTEKEVLYGERNTSYYINGDEYPYLRIYIHGYICWLKDNNLHRTDGPASYRPGSKFWNINGKYYRTDGPCSLFSDGSKLWKVNDKYHRTDGPAYVNGFGEHIWYIDGVETTQENVEKLKEKYFYKWKRKMNF